jgi:hypothetical protein
VAHARHPHLLQVVMLQGDQCLAHNLVLYSRKSAQRPEPICHPRRNHLPKN